MLQSSDIGREKNLNMIILSLTPQLELNKRIKIIFRKCNPSNPNGGSIGSLEISKVKISEREAAFDTVRPK